MHGLKHSSPVIAVMPMAGDGSLRAEVSVADWRPTMMYSVKRESCGLLDMMP
jgi:hypothetical protein